MFGLIFVYFGWNIFRDGINRKEIKEKWLKYGRSPSNIKTPRDGNADIFEGIEVHGDGSEKIILNWGTFGQSRHHTRVLFEGRGLFSHCPVSNCRISTDKSDLNVADAVILTMLDRDKASRCPDIPPYRPNYRQSWIFFQQEPPTDCIWWRYKCFDNIINATMTHRQDSDIYAPLMRVVKREKGKLYKADMVGKFDHERPNPKMVAWFVSHCHTQSRREIYARELAKHIEVDIYGSCGNLSCAKFNSGCDRNLTQTYNFYLSFENSICKDYVTEKCSRPLLSGLIPVVIGGADYSKILPKGSYIDVNDFESPKHLATYMKKVVSEPEVFKSFFEWREKYVVAFDKHHIDFCGLCSYLNRNVNTSKVYQDLSQWWYKCKSPIDYYRGITYSFNN